MVPEHKKKKIIENEIAGNNLWEMIQASLLISAPASKEKQRESDLHFITKLEQITGETSYKCKEKMKSKISDYNYTVGDAKEKLKELIKNYEKERKLSKACDL